MTDLTSLIQTGGYIAIFATIFAESGILLGFFLPGDSLLFTAGFLASQGYLHIVVLVIGSFIAAVLGDSLGYWIGRRYGHRVFSRPESRLLNPAHIERARQFYADHGAKTIVLARFVPVVRTIAPVLAGVGHMSYSQFISYNIWGGFLWAVGLPLIGYFLGNTIPSIDRYLLPVVGIMVLISILPIVKSFLKHTS